MLVPKRITARFFESRAGNAPVRDWLRALPREERRTVGDDIKFVEYKWPIGRPHVAHLRGGVWEVRTTIGRREVRTLFAVDDSWMILLHAFVKKTRATPLDEIELAEQRLKDYMNGKT